MNNRVFVLSVKDKHGDWKMLTALEVRVAQPIELYTDTAGVLAIRKAGTADTPEAAVPAERA